MVTGRYGQKLLLHLALACLFIAIVFFTTGCKLQDALSFLERLMDRLENEEVDPSPPEAADDSEKIVTLYFADNQASDDMVPGLYGFVTPVLRSISPDGELLPLLIGELIAGPLPEDGHVGPTLPNTSELLGFSLDEGTAVLNFCQKFALEHPGGVLGTQVTVESLVYTATEMATVQFVQVLVEEHPWSDGYGFTWEEPLDRTGITAALETGEEETATTGPLSDWDTYRNEAYGFQLKHPANWSVYEYEWVDPGTGEILSESIMIASHDIIGSLEEMAEEDGSIPTTLANIPVVVNRYADLKEFESDEHTTVVSEEIILDGRTGLHYTLVFLTAAPHVEAGSVAYYVIIPTAYGSLSISLQVEQYKDIFELILMSLQFIE